MTAINGKSGGFGFLKKSCFAKSEESESFLGQKSTLLNFSLNFSEIVLGDMH